MKVEKVPIGRAWRLVRRTIYIYISIVVYFVHIFFLNTGYDICAYGNVHRYIFVFGYVYIYTSSYVCIRILHTNALHVYVKIPHWFWRLESIQPVAYISFVVVRLCLV